MKPGAVSLGQKIVALLRLIRYRFLVVAGLFPYLVASAAAYRAAKPWQPHLFLLGLLGIGSALAAVEAFNEYFDAQTGNDFVLSLEPRAPLPGWVPWMGLGALLLAAAMGVLLSFLRDGWIMAFAAAGGVGVVFYVGPPLRLAYRGLGEAIIAACYGPLMILGAFYLQVGRVTGDAVLLSIPLALLMLALVLINELPDYYQDRLVGKKNLVVRLGRHKAARVYGCLLGLFYVSLAAGIALRAIPMFCVVLLLTLPFAWRMYLGATRHAEAPRALVPAIRGTILLFCATSATMALGYLLNF